MKRLISVLIPLVLAFLCGTAAAQSSPPIVVKASQMFDMVKASTEGGFGAAGVLIEEGVNLAGALFSITLAWMLMMYFLDSSIRAKADIIRHAIAGMVVLAMLASWSTNSPTSVMIDTSGGTKTAFNLGSYRIPSVTVKDLFVDTFDGLQKTVLSAAAEMKFSSGNNVTLFQVVGKSIADIEEGRSKRDAARAAVAAKLNVVDRVANFFETIWARLFGWIMDLGVSILGLAMMLLLVIVIFSGNVMAILGMIVGPLMVPCMLFKPLSFLWEAWLKFIINVGFYKLTAAVTILMTSKTIDNVQVLATQMVQQYLTIDPTAVTWTAELATTLMTICYMVLGCWLLWKTHYLTDMLMTGRIGLGLANMGINKDRESSRSRSRKQENAS